MKTKITSSPQRAVSQTDLLKMHKLVQNKVRRDRRGLIFALLRGESYGLSVKGSYKKTDEYHSLENLHWWLRTALQMKAKSICSGQLPSCLGWLVGFFHRNLGTDNFFHRNLGKDNFFTQEQFNSLAQQYKISSENKIAEASGVFFLSWFCGLKNTLHLKRKH